VDLDFTVKAAFVTGGAKGIGKSIVETLVACGANVGVMARGKEELDATKHALLGLTKGTASDYAEHGIRINTVSPGVIRTPLTMAEGQKDVTDRLAARIPQGRLGEPEEVARTVAFILSDLSSYTTGTDIVVDGAFLLGE
jgi:NAD(P)-dependent dehydrogenase (short-subunit alcohol dehydrogenase family)